MCRHMQAVNAANAPILPIMLSTMALPEMEAEEKGLLADQAASMDAMSDTELHAFLVVCHPFSACSHLPNSRLGDLPEQACSLVRCPVRAPKRILRMRKPCQRSLITLSASRPRKSSSTAWWSI